jgi:hypothetical protein
MSAALERLREHFRLLDDETDEVGDWQPFPSVWVLEGSLICDPETFGPNRWRRVPGRHGPEVELDVHLHGDRVRIRLPYRLSKLPDDGAVRIEPSLGGGAQRRWFEQVKDETHMILERLP